MAPVIAAWRDLSRDFLGDVRKACITCPHTRVMWRHVVRACAFPRASALSDVESLVIKKVVDSDFLPICLVDVRWR